MPVMVRVEKLKNLQIKAYTYLLSFVICCVLGNLVEISLSFHSGILDTTNNKGKEGLFCKFLNFSALTITGINSHSNSYNIKDSPQPPPLGSPVVVGDYKVHGLLLGSLSLLPTPVFYYSRT